MNSHRQKSTEMIFNIRLNFAIMWNEKLGRLFDSFGILCAGMLAVFLQSGSYKAFGVLFDDIVEEYKTSNTYAGWVLTFQESASYIVAGIAGSLLAGFKNRTVGVIGGVLFGLGFVMNGLLCQNNFQLFIFTGVTAVGGGGLYFSMYMAFVEHFDSETFPTAYSTKELFTYLGIIVIPIMVDIIRRQYGLFGSYLIMGAVSWNTVISGMLLKPTKRQTKASLDALTSEDAQLSTHGDTSNNLGNSSEGVKHKLLELVNLAPIVEHPTFALFMAMHSFFCLTFASWAIFLVPFGKSQGLSSEVAVLLSAAGGVGGFLGKTAVVIVVWYDRMNVVTSSVVPATICTISLSAYLVASSFLGLATASFFCGFALAYGDTAVTGSLPNYLCKMHFRQGAALTYFCSGLFIQIGGIVSGALLDVSGSFSMTFGFTAIVNIVTIVLGLLTYKLHDGKVKECQ